MRPGEGDRLPPRLADQEEPRPATTVGSARRLVRIRHAHPGRRPAPGQRPLPRPHRKSCARPDSKSSRNSSTSSCRLAATAAADDSRSRQETASKPNAGMSPALPATSATHSKSRGTQDTRPHLRKRPKSPALQVRQQMSRKRRRQSLMAAADAPTGTTYPPAARLGTHLGTHLGSDDRPVQCHASDRRRVTTELKMRTPRVEPGSMPVSSLTRRRR